MLGLRLLAREWRAGELRLLVVALVIAVGAVTAIALFADRLQRGMSQQSAELLGADLVLLSPEPADSRLLALAGQQQLRQSAITEFASVVVHGDRLQLASVRAVDERFPLRGALRTAPDAYAPDAPTNALPAPGTVWVDGRLLHMLGIGPGARLSVGKATFTIDRVLTYEPGRGGNVFGVAPRVLMRRAEVAATGVIQPGSRVTYGYGFAGSRKAIAAWRETLRARLDAHQRLIDPREGNATVTRALDRVDRYLGLTGLLAVMLAGAAIALATRRYTVRHYDTSALLRCCGASQGAVLRVFLPPLALLGLLASLVGCALGWFGQAVIHWLLRDLMPVALPLPGLKPLVLGLLTGVITLAGFAVPPLLQLKRVPPLRVLRRELLPMSPSVWFVYGSAVAALALLAWRYTGSAKLTLIVLGGAFAAAILLAVLAFAILSALRGLRPRLGAAWRYGASNLWRRSHSNIGQVMAFGFALMAMALIALVRTDLLLTWQRQLPPNTPNYFVFNVLPDDVLRVERFFATHGVSSQALYPMVRGRLVTIDGEPVARAVTKDDEDQRDDGALHRELNLTWSATLPPDNELLSGQWWGDDATALVSVESRLAQRLGIGVGSRLGFSIGGQPLAATVASLRKVQWDSFHPNFYMIFKPGTLDGFPATYLTSFHLQLAQKQLLAPFVREFPTVSLLETEQLLAQVRRLLAQVTVALEFVLLFVLAAGLAVLGAAVGASLDERLHEGAVLRTLGASHAQLRAAQLVEFCTLGAAAGVLAALGTELIAALLYTRVFELPYSFKWPVWLIAPLAGAVVIGFAGYLGTRRVRRASPLAVLREL